MIFQLTKNSDSVVIESSHVSIGVISVQSIDDSIDGTNSYNSVKKEFKYTVDGCNWSQDWIEVSSYNLSAIPCKKAHPFTIKFKYTKIGDNTTPISINSITVNAEYEKIPSPPTFKRIGAFEEIDFWNQDSLQWYVNVLQKIYAPGILPIYIERGNNNNKNWEDQDFLDFWFPMIYLYALVYKRQIQTSDILHFKKDLFKYLEQRDITPSYISDLGDLYEIASEFISMMSRRGGVDMIMPKDWNKDRYNNGEIIRIFGINTDIDEFQFIRLKNSQVPWCVDISSPCYSTLDGISEAEKKSWLQKYSYGYVNDNTESGYDKSTPTTVSKNQSYIIEFDIRCETSSPNIILDMNFGIMGLDVYGNIVFLDESIGFNSCYFIKKSISIVPYESYHFYGIAYSPYEVDLSASSNTNSYGYGKNLTINNSKIVRIYPFLYVKSEDVPFIVSGYAVKPLKTDTSRFFMNDSNQSIIISKNKNYNMGKSDIVKRIDEKLSPYDQTNIFKILNPN